LRRLGQEIIELGLRRRREQRIEVCARRAVEAEQARSGGGDDAERLGQRGQVVEVGRRQPRPGPGDDLAEPARLRAPAGRQALEQPAIGVPADHPTTQLAHSGDDLARLRPAGG
jgi:hypothetical protein